MHITLQPTGTILCKKLILLKVLGHHCNISEKHRICPEDQSCNISVIIDTYHKYTTIVSSTCTCIFMWSLKLAAVEEKIASARESTHLIPDLTKFGKITQQANTSL